MPLAKAINPLIRRYGAKNEVIAAELDSLWKDVPDEDLVPRVDFKEGTLVKGRVISLGKDGLTVDIGSKTVGVVATREFESAEAIPKPGEEIVVLIEEESNDDGLIGLSKRRADRKMAWEKVVSTCSEGDQVRGKVAKKIKGGLLILIEGVPAFLPASQVSIRRTKDINEFIDEELDCEIIKIDPVRENIVVSARKLQERTRERLKDALLGEIEEGQIREGIVKNIADFGAFVDLGGIDGLLHITDMTWGRIQHPSEIVKINATVEVKVLKVDRDRERIALGMKQLTDSPWKGIAERYPVGSRHKGTVVNIMSYGAFIRLEEGIEGLVHVSEMSWTKRVNDPREVMSLNDDAEIIILGVNEEKQEISLGMKQLEENPWDMVSERYQPGKKVGGSVRNLTTYGAFIEIEPGIDGLLHVSDMSWTRKVSHPNEMVKKGDHLDCVVLAVDTDKHRIALGMKQTTTDPWEDEIPERFKLGSELEGTITKITNFGVFVELDNELEGLLHISELADDSIDKPEDKVKVGQRISVQVIKLDPAERKIGLTALSFNVPSPEGAEEPAAEEAPTAEEAPAEEPASEEPATEEAPAEEEKAEEAPAEEATDEKSDASK